jgi:peptidyl-prolyl cis-trans isomerase B (cyclophilin B)
VGVVATQGQTNTLAVISLVSAVGAPLGHLIGIGGITLIIVSIITGHMARAEIRKTGESGAGLALAGLIISYVHLAIIAVVLIFFFGLIMALIAGIFGAASGSR